MASVRIPSNERVPPDLEDDPKALLKLALEMLDEVPSLLHALSPWETKGALEHPTLRAVWSEYQKRHRMLQETFEWQHSAFARRVRAYLQRHEDERS
jgi:hypothetical protein